MKRSRVVTHFLPDVQLPRHTVVREIRSDGRLQQFRRLSVLVVLLLLLLVVVMLRRRRLYPRFRAPVELGLLRLVHRRRGRVVMLRLAAVAVGSRVAEHVLVVFTRHRLYGGRRSGAVFLPASKKKKK